MTDTREREIAEMIARILADALINGGYERGRDVVTDIETALAAYGREQRAEGYREGAEAMRARAVHAANNEWFAGARQRVIASQVGLAIEKAIRDLPLPPLPTPPDGESNTKEPTTRRRTNPRCA